MKKDELIKKYREYQEKLYAYYYALSLISYDNETTAPKASLSEKSNYNTFLGMEVYKLETNEEYIQVVNELFNIKDKLSSNLKREIELIKKDLDKTTKLPKELIEEELDLDSNSYIAWLKAKDASDFSIFAPYLDRWIKFAKKRAEYIGLINNNVYDTLLDEYEETVTTKELDIFFGKLKDAIIPLIKKIEKSKVKINDDFTRAKVSREKQLKLANYALKQIGFDFKRGVVGETEHPFTTKISPNDVRVTTHIYENAFLSNFFSIVHEGGHALYDMNLSKKLGNTILREGTSSAIHESQSRFYENIIGRSEEFTGRIYKKVISILPKEYKSITPYKLYLGSNVAMPSLNRCDSDELTYTLHIIIRYEMEKMFLNGDVDVYELPKIWNKLYKEYLGVDVLNDKEGILQDVHWNGGFAYFPSYALGNVISAQILNTMQKEMDVFGLVKDGKIKQINDWLKNNVYIYGMLVSPKELVKIVTKEDINPDYYIKYLTDKFTKIYEL